MDVTAAKPQSLRAVAQAIAPIGVALVAVAASITAVALAGESPVDALDALIEGSFGSRTAIAATLARMVPLTLVGLGWIVAFSTRRVSIGFEGQIVAGGIAATIVGLNFAGLPAAVHIAAATMAAALGGALWVAVPAAMWARRGVHEIISTLLMNLIAFELLSWLVRGPLQESSGAFARTDAVHDSALWPELLSGTRLHWDSAMVVVLILVVFVVLRYTALGLKLRFVGANPVATRYLGHEPTRLSAMSLVVSGALAGIAGGSLILAMDTATMSPNFSAGYGFEGIVVALLARNKPIAVPAAALLFASLRQGSGLMEARLDVSSAIVTLSLGLVVVLMATFSGTAGRSDGAMP